MLAASLCLTDLQQAANSSTAMVKAEPGFLTTVSVCLAADCFWSDRQGWADRHTANWGPVLLQRPSQF